MIFKGQQKITNWDNGINTVFTVVVFLSMIISYMTKNMIFFYS